MYQGRPASARRKHLEPGEPVHRLDRRRSERQGPRRGARGRAAAARGRVRVRRRLHVGPEARHPHVLDRARRARSALDSGEQALAPERAPLRRAAGPEQSGNRRQARRGADRRSGGAATTSRRRRSTPTTRGIRRTIRATPDLSPASCRRPSRSRTRSRASCLLDGDDRAGDSRGRARARSPRTATACARS